MKKITLALILGIAFYDSFAQVSMVDRFGNVKSAQAGNEPWRIQNTSTPSGSNTDNIYQNANVGLGDFSAEVATQRLDVKGNARIRLVPRAIPIFGTVYNASTDANRAVTMREDGTLAYRYEYAAPALISTSTLDLSSIAPEALRSMYIFNWATFENSTINITLPPAAANAGRELIVYVQGTATNTLTIRFLPTASATIISSTTNLGPYVKMASTDVTISINAGGTGGTTSEFIRIFNCQRIAMISTGGGWLYNGPR